MYFIVHRSYIGQRLFSGYIIPKISRVKAMGAKKAGETADRAESNASDSLDQSVKVSVLALTTSDSAESQSKSPSTTDNTGGKPSYEQEHMIIKFQPTATETTR